MKIIPCNFDDQLHKQKLVELMNHYISDKMGGGQVLDDNLASRLIDGLRNHPSAIVLFAELDGEIVGLANCFVNFATFTVAKFINIHDIVVLEAFRGKGVGRALLQHISAIAKELGCSKVTLEVREDNINAQGLYKSEGFDDCFPRMYYWVKYFDKH